MSRSEKRARQALREFDQQFRSMARDYSTDPRNGRRYTAYGRKQSSAPGSAKSGSQVVADSDPGGCRGRRVRAASRLRHTQGKEEAPPVVDRRGQVL